MFIYLLLFVLLIIYFSINFIIYMCMRDKEDIICLRLVENRWIRFKIILKKLIIDIVYFINYMINLLEEKWV